MIDSLISNRDRQVTVLKRKTVDRKMVFTKRHVIGSLQDTIRKHGPITPALIESAVKRIYNGCFHVIRAVDSKPDLDDNTD